MLPGGGMCSVDSDCPIGYHCDGGLCVPDGGGGPIGDPLPGLGNYLRPRYTSNVAITEQMSALDLLYDVLFVGCRGYLRQSQSGRIGLRNKKPVPFALAVSGISAGASTIDVDNVSDWAGLINTWLLIAPYTNVSEIRQVSLGQYSFAQNSVSLSSTGGLFTIVGFSGSNGNNHPATARIVVTGTGSPPVSCSITLDGVTFEFTSGGSDTTESIASYIAGVIASHPVLSRRFSVSWTSGSSTVNLTARFGTLTLSSPVSNNHAAPVTTPTAAASLSASGSGSSLAAGIYAVAYSAVNANGETLLSYYKTITITAGQIITVGGAGLPSGATAIRWYFSPEANSPYLRYLRTNTGAGFTVSGSLPLLSASLPPDLNRTGTEVMMVSAVFSDRAEPRASRSSSNVLKATFNWLMGNREDTVNRIDLKYRDRSQDYRLITLRLRDDASIAKLHKTLNKEFNGQAIDNTDQATRIASGLLSEKQDADFFYSWQSLREALLLQEGDVVACTDDGSGVYNIPVFIEQIDYEVATGSAPVPKFTARKYSSRLYGDSIVYTTIPIISED